MTLPVCEALATGAMPSRGYTSTRCRSVLEAPREIQLTVNGWPSTMGCVMSATFAANAVTRAGSYRVQVVAQGDGSEVTSEPLPVEVITAAAPPPVPPLIGRYATRAHGFWMNGRGGSMTTVKELSLAEFVRVGDEVELRMQLCSQVSSSLGFSVAMTAPEAYPEIRRKVTFERDGFRTDAVPVGTGYARAGVAACEGRAGQAVPKRGDQSWIRGSSCRCPYSPASATPMATASPVSPTPGRGPPSPPTGRRTWSR
jgi:hypothetical protein